MPDKPTTIDEYLTGLAPDARSLLDEFRRRVEAMLPGAQPCISYGMPAYRVGGKAVAGFAVWKAHGSFYPHSGGIVPRFAADLAALGLTHTKSAVHFTAQTPLPDDLLHRMIAARCAEAGVDLPPPLA
ncbi:hypothetical protein EU803_05705 [Loktanella sp. IMCC34160]|uniref:iron chaperone n=1 Tax=Loktanella sp. IMCC34160 TaxID=2510646 RepID=UPI00101D6459|nr:DUF1801 domain-containing protein [Loktanella sp. IMCC34160]RYG91946.1 hypothetical protein EU803_05705 [Loktanella sp. IMCC34160]